MKSLRALCISIVVLGALGAAAGRADAAAGYESRTITPTDGTYTTTRVQTTFGDSIAAGYCGLFCRNDSLTVRYAKRVADARDAKVDYRGRAVSGEVMSEIVDEISANLSDLKAADYVTLEGCGNDFLDARSTYRNSSNCTDESPLANALSTCKTQMVRALDLIAANRKAGSVVQIMALYYPGINADKSRTCNGMTHFDVFLDYITEANWFTCNEAWKRGFKCMDGLAAFNAADVDTTLDADTLVDASQIRISQAVDANNFAGYYSRVYDNKAVLTDASYKRISATSTVDYLLSDDTHPTNAGHQRLADETANQGL
jgi:lysophospholipase L1-like esterase